MPSMLARTTRKSKDDASIARKRAQSRASTQRWRQSQQQSVAAMRRQVAELEADLAAKLFHDRETPTELPPAMEQLVAAKKYYVHENMQLRAALQKYQALMNQTLLPLLRTVKPLVFDDAFVRGEISRAKMQLDALDLRSSASLPGRQFHGWSCVTHTHSDAVVYDIQKRFQHVSLHVISNHIWHVYQDSATYVQLGDLILDHEVGDYVLLLSVLSVLRTIGDNVLVLRISTWLTSLQQAIPMYLVLYREVSPTSYTLYVATLRPDLRPNAHTFAFHGEASLDGYVSSCKGVYSLVVGSVVDADSILEQMIFSHCRFEALLKSSFKDLRLCDR